MPVVVKKMDREAWRTLKSEAAKHGVTTGKMIEIVIKEHVEREKRKAGLWKKLLDPKRKPGITKKEAERIKKSVEEFSKNFEFRI